MPGTLSKAVAQVIASAAEELFVTQTELGDRTGLGQSVISRGFSGKRKFSLDQLALICNALGLSLPAVISEAQSGLDYIEEDEG